MKPQLIVMLTYNDETVKNSFEVFDACADLPVRFWGFKDVGLPKNEMKRLVRKMKDKGKTTFLEVVSLSEEEGLDGADIAADCGFDYLMGTVFFPSIFDAIRKSSVKYFPFCGTVYGHPSILDGKIPDIIEQGNKMISLGIKGFDLLGYRYTGNAEELSGQFIKAMSVPVVLAGSIDGTLRLDAVKRMNPWAFTIGSAFFDKKFAESGDFGEQIARVLEYLEK